LNKTAGEESLRSDPRARKFKHEVVWALLSLDHKPATPTMYIRIYRVSGSRDAPLRSSVAILSQLRLLDIKRLSLQVEKGAKETFDLIKEKISNCSPDLFVTLAGRAEAICIVSKSGTI